MLYGSAILPRRIDELVSRFLWYLGLRAFGQNIDISTYVYLFSD
jgi:hypothetical protein